MMDRSIRRAAARKVAKTLNRMPAVRYAGAVDGAFVLDNVTFANPLHAGKIDRVFGPVDRLFDSYVDTGLDTLPDGTPLLIVESEQTWCPLVPALESMCDTFSKLARTKGWEDCTDGMRRLAKRFELQMPVFQKDVDAARASVRWMRQQTLLITPKEFSAESLEVQIDQALKGNV